MDKHSLNRRVGKLEAEAQQAHAEPLTVVVRRVVMACGADNRPVATGQEFVSTHVVRA
jgi:hypothetical protein